MEIPKGISDLLNWNTIIGKVAWAVLGLVWKWLWKTCKSWEAGLKRQVAQIITMILGGVLLLTLIGQISVSISGYMGMQNYPSFKMVIFNPGLSDSNPRTHTLSVDAKIWNDGAPSVVVGWSLSIKGPDKRSYTFPQLVVLPGCHHRAVENRPEESDSKPATLREGVHISFGSSIKRRLWLRAANRAGVELRASSSRPRRLKVCWIWATFLVFLGEHRGFLDTITFAGDGDDLGVMQETVDDGPGGGHGRK